MMRFLRVFWVWMAIAGLLACESEPQTDSNQPADTTTGEASPRFIGLQLGGTGTVGEATVTWTLQREGTIARFQFVRLEEDAPTTLMGEYPSGAEEILLQDQTAGADAGGRLRMYGEPVRESWSGYWHSPAEADSLPVRLQLQEVLIGLASEGWPREGLRLELREAGIYSPDSACQVLAQYLRSDQSDALGRQINALLAPPPLEQRSQQLRDCVSYAIDDGDEWGDLPPSQSITNVVPVALLDSILVLRRSYYDYMAGAAHGNYGQASEHYLLPGLQPLAADDFLAEGYQRGLSERVRMGLLQQYGQDAGNLEYKGLPDNWSFELGPEGMTVYFNPYEIGPYVMGIIEVMIPYEELRPWLNPDGKLAGAVVQ